MSQLSFLSVGLKGKLLRCSKLLEEISRVIPWDNLCKIIKPYYRTGEGGRPAKPLALMLKIYCLQQWYNLSDPAIEDAIYDRNSFQQFLSLDLIDEGVPDETTILSFRHLLEEYDLGKKIFETVTEYLESKGLLLKQGTIADATIISAPDSSKRTRDRHAEMSSTRKGNKLYFGMKAHIGTDSSSGLVHSVECTTARTNDIEKLDKLCHGKEKAIFGDKGYAKKAVKKMCREKGIFYGILDKAERYRRLSSSQKKQNFKLSKIRAKVEFTFRIIKHLWGYRKVRYRTLAKNANNIYMLFSLSNLYQVRKDLRVA